MASRTRGWQISPLGLQNAEDLVGDVDGDIYCRKNTGVPRRGQGGITCPVTGKEWTENLPREILQAHVIKATGEIYFEDTDISEGLLSEAAAVALARGHFLKAGVKPEKLERANNSRMRSAWLVRLQPLGDERAAEASYLGVSTMDGSIIEGKSLTDLMERELRSSFGAH